MTNKKIMGIFSFIQKIKMPVYLYYSAGFILV